MKILVIGGSGFIGPPLVRELCHSGHTVAVFHRGGSAADLPGDVEHIRGDRNQLAASASELRRFAPEVVIDLILSSGRQAEQLMQIFRGVARRIVAISSMDVYRAAGVLHGTEPGPLEPLPLTEDSPVRQNLGVYPAPLLKSLQAVFGWLDDDYDKIPAERAVLGDPDLPATVLRLPMVYGPGDPLRRFHPVMKRIADGRRQIIFEAELAAWRSPRGYVENVAHAIALAASSEAAVGRAASTTSPKNRRFLSWTGRAGSPPLASGMVSLLCFRASARPSICFCPAISSSTGWPAPSEFAMSLAIAKSSH